MFRPGRQVQIAPPISSDIFDVTEPRRSILSRSPAPFAPRGPSTSAAHDAGFSLIELVLVIVILALIAAIAIPKLSRGSQGSAEAATAKNLAVLQRAIDLYAAEHNGAYPDPDLIAEQLTQYSDARGAVSGTKGGGYAFGPYVRKVPPVPTGPNKGSTGIGAAAGHGIGWLYSPADGAISAYAGDKAKSPATAIISPTTSPVQ